MSNSKTRNALLTKIIEACQDQLASYNSIEHAHVMDSFPLFVEEFHHHVGLDYLQHLIDHYGLDKLISRVLRAWHLLQHRPTNSPIIDFYESPFSESGSLSDNSLIITLINNDRPFLVDSLKLSLKNIGFDPEVILHPIFKVIRDNHGNLMNLQLAQKHLSDAIVTSFDAKIQLESLLCIVIPDAGDDEKQNQLRMVITQVLYQLALVVDDFYDMKNCLLDLADRYQNFGDEFYNLDETYYKEKMRDIGDFLSWLDNDNFIYLGSRYFVARAKVVGYLLHSTQENAKVAHLTSSSDTILLHFKPFKDLENSRYSNFGLFKNNEFSEFPEIFPNLARQYSFNDQRETLEATKQKDKHLPVFQVIKTSKRSMVHRYSRINSIEILDIDESGTICGLYQFIGLFSREFFTHSAFKIPLLQHKVQRVFDRFGLSPEWHDGKYLISILKSIPQDELFQFSENELYYLCEEILEIDNNKNLSLFLRPDPHGRYISILIYIPRGRYSFELKQKFLDFLKETFQGVISSEQVFMSEFPFARMIVVISFETPQDLKPNKEYLKQSLKELSLSWEEQLDLIASSYYVKSNAKVDFPSTYQDSFSPEQARVDLEHIIQLSEHQNIIFDLLEEDNDFLILKVFHASYPLSLSMLMPILENFGLKVITEVAYELDLLTYHDHKVRQINNSIWLHYFKCDKTDLKLFVNDKKRITSALHDVWHQAVENDVFNQLVLKTHMSSREVIVFRAYARFLKQVQFGYSFEHMASVLVTHKAFTQKLCELFITRFSPFLDDNERQNNEQSLLDGLKKDLNSISRSDHDRVLRQFLNCIISTVRTNYYQDPIKPYLSFKFDCQKLKDLPKPSPLYEIFVYSPIMEACHLRGDKVARGGIRWSDRFEDFRSEVLGLMKAQMVKNSVIVPLGSKGGFICKRYEQLQMDGALPLELKQEVVSCYQMMMGGLLGITDNLDNGNIVRPQSTVCYDDIDPYLVVAADKGTASFSDYANQVSSDYGFWLGDAFASGGSKGYDHKKIAITARGAWVSVKRHFRELGFDCQTTPFTVVGVGDMAGDVFGNGMLQSKFIRLIGAFNHQHIFIDPDPDPAISFDERQRLFDLPGSSWADYNPQCLSAGGGVFSRSAKAIALSPEIKKAFGIDKDKSEITPDELITILLKLQVDLLWFGGIGTFIKASSESNSEVRDRQNDVVRINATDIKAKVIGEGANLGMTQKARIEYALKGGKLNTDAIDNSAGVDCSDHEVNIKILFSSLLRSGNLSLFERDEFLKTMTESVVELILEDNYRQTLILSLMEGSAVEDLDMYQSLIRHLEGDSFMPLDRVVEYLPSEEELNRRRTFNQGLTRPELSILLAYSKNSLYRQLLSIMSKDNYEFDHSNSHLKRYFPSLIQEKFEDTIIHHPLRKEIIATVMANEIINRMGPCFLLEVSQIANVEIKDVVQAYFRVVEVFGFNNLWHEIEQLDFKIEAKAQYELFSELMQTIRQLTLVLLRHKSLVKDERRQDHLAHSIKDLLVLFNRHTEPYRHHQRIQAHHKHLSSHTLDLLHFLPLMLELVFHHMHFQGKEHVGSLIDAFFEAHIHLSLSLFNELDSHINARSEWQRITKAGLYDELIQAQVNLAWHIFKAGGFSLWKEQNASSLLQYNELVLLIQASMNGAAKPDLGLLTHSVHFLRQMAR